MESTMNNFSFMETTILRSSNLVLFRDLKREGDYVEEERPFHESVEIQLSFNGYITHTHRKVNWKNLIDEIEKQRFNGWDSYPRPIVTFEEQMAGTFTLKIKGGELFAVVYFSEKWLGDFIKNNSMYPGVFLNPLVSMHTFINKQENMDQNVYSKINGVFSLFITTLPLKL